MCGLRGAPQPPSWRIDLNGTTYCFHSDVNVKSAPKSLKHSLHTLPSGSVLTSGTFRRTLPVELSARRAQKVTPANFEASYWALGSMKLTPRPAKTTAPVPTLPWKRAAQLLPCPPSLIVKAAFEIAP